MCGGGGGGGEGEKHLGRTVLEKTTKAARAPASSDEMTMT